MADAELLREQQAYYERWAPEYDAIIEASGSYRPRPGSPPAPEIAALLSLGGLGDCLEIAAGSGWWTWLLAEHASSVTALDGSPSMLERNRARTASYRNVRCVLADVFDWEPDRTYDSVCFAYWLSHVPARQFDSFWRLVARSLRPGGSVFFVDEAYEDRSGRWQRRVDADVTVRQVGKQEFRVVKVFREADDLIAQLGNLGFEMSVQIVGWRSLVGLGHLSRAPEPAR